MERFHKQPHEWSPTFRRLLKVVVHEVISGTPTYSEELTPAGSERPLAEAGKAGYPRLFAGFEGEAPFLTSWVTDDSEEVEYYRLGHANIVSAYPHVTEFHILTTAGEVLYHDLDRTKAERRSILTDEEINELADRIEAAPQE